MPIDTIVLRSYDSVIVQSKDALDILNKTDSFYNNAWAKLIFFWTILAVLVPSVITWYQKQALKADRKELEEKIVKAAADASEAVRKEMLEEQRKMREQIKDEFENEKVKTAEGLLYIECMTKGSAHFLQGTNNLVSLNFEDAFYDFARSAHYFNTVGSEYNTFISIDRIDKCVGWISSENLSKTGDDFNWELSLKEIIDALTKKGDNHKAIEYAKILSDILANIPATEAERRSKKTSL